VFVFEFVLIFVVSHECNDFLNELYTLPFDFFFYFVTQNIVTC